MKLLLPFLFLSNFCFGQSGSDSLTGTIYAEMLKNSEYRRNDESAYSACKLGIDSAQQDIKKGILRYFFVGQYFPYLERATNYISKKYGITPEFPGCSADADMECYNLYVNQILDKKYGTGFWERAWHEVDSLQRLGQLDRPVSYKGNAKAIHKNLFQLIKAERLTQKTDSIQLNCDVTIDTAGNIIDIKNLDCEPKYLTKEVGAVIKKLKGWLPTINKGRKEISTSSLIFVWTKETGEWWLKDL